jgi:hypothetical protein
MVVSDLKVYVVIVIQLMIWSGYSLTEWLSKHDQLIYNILMFFVFFYIAISSGNYIIRSPKKTMIVTFVSLMIYSSFHLTMTLLVY